MLRWCNDLLIFLLLIFAFYDNYSAEKSVVGPSLCHPICNCPVPPQAHTCIYLMTVFCGSHVAAGEVYLPVLLKSNACGSYVMCLVKSGELQPCVQEALGSLMKVFKNHRLLIIALLTSHSSVTVVLDTKT